MMTCCLHVPGREGGEATIFGGRRELFVFVYNISLLPSFDKENLMRFLIVIASWFPAPVPGEREGELKTLTQLRHDVVS